MYDENPAVRIKKNKKKSSKFEISASKKNKNKIGICESLLVPVFRTSKHGRTNAAHDSTQRHGTTGTTGN